MMKINMGVKVGMMVSLGFMMAGAAQPEGCDGGETATSLFAQGESRYVMSKSVHGFPGAKLVGWGEATLVDNGGQGYLAEAQWYLWTNQEAFNDHPSKPDCTIYEGPQAQAGVEGVLPNVTLEGCDECGSYFAETIPAPTYSGTCPKEITEYWTLDGATGEPVLQTLALTGYRASADAGFPEAWSEDIKWLEEEGAIGALYYARFAGEGEFSPEFVVF